MVLTAQLGGAQGDEDKRREQHRVWVCMCMAKGQWWCGHDGSVLAESGGKGRQSQGMNGGP